MQARYCLLAIASLVYPGEHHFNQLTMVTPPGYPITITTNQHH